MSTGIGETKCGPFVLQQYRDAVDVVVGQHHLDTQHQVILGECEFHERVERIGPRGLGEAGNPGPDQIGVGGRHHDLHRVPSGHKHAGCLPRFAYPVSPPGVGISGPAFLDRARRQLSKNRVGVQGEWFHHGHRKTQWSTGHLWPHLGAVFPSLAIDFKRLEVTTLGVGQHRGVGERNTDLLLQRIVLSQRQVVAAVDPNDASPGIGDCSEECFDLGPVGPPARDGAAVGADMCDRKAGCETDSASFHCFSHDYGHRLDLIGGRGPPDRVVAHRVQPHCGVADIGAEVQQAAVLLDRI